MKKYLLSLLGLALFGFAAVANATFYDFTAEGNRLEKGYDSFTTGSGNPMPSGLTLTATKAGNAAKVYLDGATSGGPGGVGVCGTLSLSDTCSPSDDDNQMPGETISILSTPNNKISSLVFTGDHGNIVDGTTLKLTLDGALQADIDLFALGADAGHLTYLTLSSLATSLSYEITGNGAQVYLSALTTVPVPAAIWLFGSALIGFVGLGRRTNVA